MRVHVPRRRTSVLLASVFAVVELAAGCQIVAPRPEAPVAERQLKKKNKKKSQPGPIGGPVDDGREGAADAERPRPSEEGVVGVASFYSDRLRGSRTASGARYDPEKATCAHRSHPFGTQLRVTNVDTGRTVVCTVNDRGPFVRGRILDVSKKLARELGMVEQGVATVQVRVVGDRNND